MCLAAKGVTVAGRSAKSVLTRRRPFFAMRSRKPAPRMSQPFQSRNLAGGERTNTALLGCLGVGLLLLVVFGALATWLFFNGRAVFSDFARDAMVGMVRDSGLPEAEQAELVTEIDRLQEHFEAGRISLEQMGRMVEAIANSPLGGAFAIVAIEANYVAPSGLSEEEKVQARRTLERIVRGLVDEKIDDEALDHALEPVSIEQAGDGGRRFKGTITDEELRTVLARGAQAADEAGIPDEPLAVNLGAELRRIIDETLARSGEANPPKTN